MSSYSHEPNELLQALRGDLPGAADKDRVRARLMALGLGAAALSPAATVSAQTASSSASALGKVGLFGGKKLFLALALTGAAGTAVWTGVSKLSAPVAVMQTLPSAESSHVTAPAAALEQPAPVVTQLAPAESAPPASATQHRTKRTRVETTHENSESTLREESVLLGQAIAALRDGQLDEAERLLAQHRAQYPEGLLAHERELAQERLRKARLEP